MVRGESNGYLLGVMLWLGEDRAYQGFLPVA